MTVRTHPATRASDGERDEVLAALQDAYVSGRISQDTLVARIDAALAARTQQDLDGLLVDLAQPVPRPRTLWMYSFVAWASECVHSVRTAWNAPAFPPLTLPACGEYLMGRSPNADHVLAHESVSRVHALLRHRHDGWYVTDLGSTNGTYINGWRIRTSCVLRDRDVVRFGAVSFRFSAQSTTDR